MDPKRRNEERTPPGQYIAGGELYDAGEEIISDVLDWRDQNRRKTELTRRINDRRNAEQRNGR